jgi:DNA polymerase-3 subunit delta
LNELAAYLENPAPTTVFLIEHRFKKVDGRGKLAKLAKDKGYYFTSDKLKDEALPKWIENYGFEIGFHINERESQILATYLGNDLQKIVNEIEKVRINVPTEKLLTAELIQKYIGISREYNVFEMPEALASGDKEKLYRMLAYFSANPKSAAMPLVIGVFYSYFSKLYQAHFLRGKQDKEIMTALNTWGERYQTLKKTAIVWSLPKVEYTMMLLGKYSAMSVGMGVNIDDKELLREMVGKLELVKEGGIFQQLG